MNFTLEKSIPILERTPIVLEQLLNGLDELWIKNNEGGESWSPYDIMGHLVHGEKTDWIQRVQIVLSASEDKKFVSFNRFAQFEESKGKSLTILLEEFKVLRRYNISLLNTLHISEPDLLKTAIHPALGEVTLHQLLATWVAHDLGHIAQVTRVMAKQYTTDVGPWYEYLSVLKR